MERRTFLVGSAMALPYADDAFDAAVMALVLFFVPDPATGVAEMARVVGPGGSVSAYGWNFFGGFPYAAMEEEIAEMHCKKLNTDTKIADLNALMEKAQIASDKNLDCRHKIRNQRVEPIKNEIRRRLREFAKINGFTLIVDADVDGYTSAIVGGEMTDITYAFIDYFNKIAGAQEKLR